MPNEGRRIAVIGAGIAGLTAAYYLSRRYEVTLLEKDTRLGGHTHTVLVNSSRGPIPVDTGFIVHNEKTYPNFCLLMRELGVETQASDMSFAVTSPKDGYEYSSHGLRGFFANPANLFNPSHYVLLKEILRFNREAANCEDDVSLGDFLRNGQYSDVFRDRYLYPMASAVWSMPLDEMNHFPARTLIRFFENHGMLGINTHPKWRVLKGGSHSYFAPLTKPFASRIRLGVEIQSIRRTAENVWIDGETFDDVVFACHGDQVLPMLADPTDRERDVLRHFPFTRNDTTLHTDETLLPRRPVARASWNYLLTGNQQVTLTYHMNRLQSLGVPENYCVTLNSDSIITESKVLKSMIYHHPRFDAAAIAAQSRWSEISGQNRTHFCGAYWFYGFHEDGVKSALRVAESLGVQA
jgi:uncharacterized protein